jgi:hypothetical protein
MQQKTAIERCRLVTDSDVKRKVCQGGIYWRYDWPEIESEPSARS